MKNGQLYGTLGVDGQAAYLLQLYDSLEDQYRRAGIQQADINYNMERLAAGAETQANRFLLDLQKMQERAKKEGKPSLGAVSQLYVAQINAARLEHQMRQDMTDAESDEERRFAKEVEKLDDKYNYDTYSKSGESNTAFNNALITIDQNATDATTIAAIKVGFDTIKPDIAAYPTEDVTKKKVHVAGAKAQLLSQLAAKGKRNAVTEQAIDNYINSTFKLLPADLEPDALQALRDAEFATIEQPATGTLGATVQELSNIRQSIADQISGLGEESESVQQATRYFRQNKALREFMDAQDISPMPYVVDQGTLQEIADRNKTTPDKIMRDYEKARRLADQNMALVPEEYVDNMSTAVMRERQRAAQLRGGIQTAPQAAPDFEKLAAQRYIATTPTPLSMYTREQRKDIKAGKVPQQVGSDVQQTNRDIQTMLRSNPEYKQWYNSLSQGQQVMQQYTISSTKLLDELKADPSRKAQGRGEKLAEQLFEQYKNNPSAGYLTADELVNQTAEAFKDRDLQDEARAYYTALVANAKSSTQPTPETNQANLEPVDMDFTFLERIMGKRAMRKYERTNKPIPVEAALQPQMQAQQAAQLEATYQDPNAMDAVDINAFTNRQPTEFERMVYSDPTMTEAPTALPLSGQQAFEIMYPQDDLDKYLYGTKQ